MNKSRYIRYIRYIRYTDVNGPEPLELQPVPPGPV